MPQVLGRPTNPIAYVGEEPRRFSWTHNRIPPFVSGGDGPLKEHAAFTYKTLLHFLQSIQHNSHQNSESSILFGQTFGAGLSVPAKLEGLGDVESSFFFGFVLGAGAETDEDQSTRCS